MSKVINAQGEYKSKKNDSNIAYEFEYVAFESMQEAIELLGEEEVLKRVQRMTKVDSSNTAREKAKVANGDSTRKVMSEEDKASAKAERQVKKTIADKISAKAKEAGVSVEDYLASL